MPAFLLEIGLEEIPAGMIAAAQSELEGSFRELAGRARLVAEGFAVKSYSTPRRLALLAEGLLPKQADLEEEVIGPSTKVGYKDDAPTPAAIAFARKSGVEVSALRTVQNAKGEYLAATVHRAGNSAAQVLASELSAAIARIAWPKNMVWRAGKPERFVRPVRWLMALLDQEIVPLEFAGIVAGGVSYGHRVLHGNNPVAIRGPREYVEKLATAWVQVDPEARRQRIRKALDAAARTIPGAHWREDGALVETVTQLTEWPSAIAGGFDASYLALPEEVLVTVMRDHQKYFALEDANRKLLPNFLAVLNIEVDASGQAVIRHGNERVLRARFNDAQFFWDADQKIPLVDRVEMLKHVTFHKDLGNYWDKTQWNVAAAERIALGFMGSLDAQRVKNATRVSKTDLTTEMVKEFTELQGIVGGLYSHAQGYPEEVSRAIYEQYRPQGSSDAIPETTLGAVVALADKMTTIVEMFKKGIIPTGSKDPFALRRAALGIIRILSENKSVQSQLHLSTVINAGFQGQEELQRSAICDFMLDRLESYLQESRGTTRQVARAIRNSGAAALSKDRQIGDLYVGYGIVVGFAEALNSHADSHDILALAELHKRASNILRQAQQRDISVGISESSLRHPAELELLSNLRKKFPAIYKMFVAGKYSDVITSIISLREPLHHFFESVMVMTDDVQVRGDRLWLMSYAKKLIAWPADFSELASIH